MPTYANNFFVNAFRSLTRQNSLHSLVKRVVEKSCDKASTKLGEADKESLICLDALKNLSVHDSQPRIRFRLEDAFTVLKSISTWLINSLDTFLIGIWRMLSISNCKNSQPFTAQMQSFLTTQQQTAQKFALAPFADDKRTAAQVKLVLCAAKDETSVDIMRRMFCCNVLRKSRL
jgi:hypothetical protein